MIDLKGQNELFELISGLLTRDVECWAFGGNAMMYYGYKPSTKDVDLIFFDKSQRDAFIAVLRQLDYRPFSPKGIYPEDKPEKPMMFTKGEERFDIFLNNVLLLPIPPSMTKDFFAKADFIKQHTLTVYVMKKEDIVLLKAATERANDFEDILNIVQKEQVNWEYIIGRAFEISQNSDGWLIYDLEEKMRLLKKHIRIEKKYFDKIYSFKPRH